MCSEQNTKSLESYYKKDPKATETAIKSFLKDSNPQKIVYGTRAINAYLPSWLDRETKDWDIFVDGTTKTAKEQAHLLEMKLDTRYGADFFSVEPAMHEGTFRVRSKVTGDVVADISMRDRVVSFKKIRGINYADLDYSEEQAERVLDTPEASYRHDKERDTLQRINVWRESQARRKKRKSDRAKSGNRSSLSGMRRF